MKTELLDAYFAGVIDGEGTVAVYTQHHGARMRPIIKVDMTCERTINALHSHFGGYIGVKKIEALPNRKPQWRWEVSFSKAKEVAIRIRPYLITKADGADSIIAFIPGARGRKKKIQEP